MEFKILGPLEVCAGGVSVDITAPRQRAVLAILLIEANRVVSLDRLIDSLYGGEPPPHATGSVQAYVSHLRRLLEPDRRRRGPPQVLVSRPSGYVLVADPRCCDAACFEAALSSGQGALAGGRPAAALTELDQGLGLWRGPALAEFAYEAFAGAEAARLEALRMNALEARIDARLALGSHQMVVAEAQRCLSEHPLRERLWASLILALYRCGRQGDALDAYQRCRSVLADELGVDPGPELRRLEADILAQSPSLDWAPSGPRQPAATPAAPARAPTATRVVPEPAGPTPLSAAGHAAWPAHPVGRDGELEHLGQAMASVREGHGIIALIGGEAGIGKTTIVEAFGRALGSDEAMVWGLGHEGEGAPAFWMWGQVLRGLAQAGGSGFGEALARAGVQRDRLGALVPEWSQPAEPPTPPLDPAEALSRLYRDAAAALVAVSAGRPVVVVLDDLHWADAASLGLLEFIAPHLRRSSVLLVGTYRDDEVGEAHPLTATLGALARLPGTLRLFPRPLSESEVGAYLATLTEGPLDAGVVEVIRARTEGNPFFLIELVKLLVSERSLSSRASAQAAPVPAGVREVIRRRLGRLPEQTNAVLSVAAVIGQDFDLDTLEAATQLDDETTEEALELALVSGVVADSPAGAGRHRFCHALIRETLYEGMSQLRRTRLHAKIATALEQIPGADPAALAHHSFEAAAIVGVERAVAASLRAADTAQVALAFERAEHLLRRAIALLTTPESTGGLPQRERQELRVQAKLMNLLTITRGYADPGVEAAATRILDLCRSVADSDEEILGALCGLALSHNVKGDLDASASAVQAILEVSRTSELATFTVGAHLHAGILAWHRGQLPRAREHLGQALVAVDSLPWREGGWFDLYANEPAVASRVFLATACSISGDQPRAVELMGEALTLARRTRHPYLESFSLFFSAWLALLVRDPVKANRDATRAAELAGSGGFVLAEALNSVIRGWAISQVGERDAGLSILVEAISRVRATGAGMLQATFMALLAEAQIAAGCSTEALATIRQALANVESSGERLYEAELHRLHGELLATRPRSAVEAAASFERAITVASQQGALLFKGRAEESLLVHARGNDSRTAHEMRRDRPFSCGLRRLISISDL
jgi:DNA-binding SARP family transcriptional activator